MKKMNGKLDVRNSIKKIISHRPLTTLSIWLIFVPFCTIQPQRGFRDWECLLIQGVMSHRHASIFLNIYNCFLVKGIARFCFAFIGDRFIQTPAFRVYYACKCDLNKGFFFNAYVKYSSACSNPS